MTYDSNVNVVIGIGTTTSPYIEENVWSPDQGSAINNNNSGAQSPSRDPKNPDQSTAIHVSPSHSTTHGEIAKNGDRSPKTSSADLQIHQEQLSSHMSSMSISPSSSSPIRNQGIIGIHRLAIQYSKQTRNNEKYYYTYLLFIYRQPPRAQKCLK